MKTCLSVLLVLTSMAMAQTPVQATNSDPATVPASAPVAKTSIPAPGAVAPPFKVISPDGKEIKLSDYAGKIVVLDFWATWCGPCQQAMPHNNDIYERYRDSGVVLLGICSNDTQEAYDGWVSRNSRKYSFPTGFDPAARDYDNSFVRNAYGVTGFPTMFVVGRDGKIVGMASGGGREENPRLLRLLAKAGAPVDLSKLPPEEQNKGSASVPAAGKSAAMPMMGMSAGKDPGRFGSVTLGTPAPDFTAVDEKGEDVKLSSFKGHTVVVHFFTGTKPQPFVQDMATKYADQGVMVFGVSTATERADFDAWVAAGKSGVIYPVAWDSAGKAFMESAAYMQFGVGMFPGYVVVDAEGRTVAGSIGFGAGVSGNIHAALAKAGVTVDAADMAPAAAR
jgi:peroxiredoxin